MGTPLDASKETRPYPAPEPVTAALLFSRDICIAPVAPPSCCPKSSATAPVMFRISSRPQLPASRSAPSTQFRKGAPLFENFIGLKGFSPSPRPFRAWTLGTGREAGSSQLDALQQMTGSVKASRLWYGGDEVELSGVFSSVSHEVGNAGPGGGNQPHMGFLFDPSRVVRTAAETRPMNVSQPIITYLGRPR